MSRYYTILSRILIYLALIILIFSLFAGAIPLGIVLFIILFIFSFISSIIAKGSASYSSWRNEKRELRQRQLEELRKKQTDPTDREAPHPIDHKSEPVPDVQFLISKMTDEQKLAFESEYEKKSKSVGLMVFLSIIFPIQFLLLGRIGLQIVFFLTAYGFGLWYIIEWFLTPRRVKEYNEVVAMDIAQDILK